MKLTDIPAKQPVPFGVSGQREPLLPTTPAGDNTASYTNGFPPVTMIPKSAGGLPPKGQNMNQILFELSAICRWFSAGGSIKFDVAFCNAIGGYPMGSYIMGDDNKTLYRCTNDNNSNNPNSSGSGWVTVAKDIADILSLRGAAYLEVGTSQGTVAAGDDSRIVMSMQQKTGLDTENINTIGSSSAFGFYYQPDSSKATTARGYPINEAGTLLVARMSGGCYQEYTTFVSNRKFVRSLISVWNGVDGPWGGWTEYARTSDIVSNKSQAWTDVTSQRVSNVNYTNTTKSPIQVSVCSGTRDSSSFYVDSKLVSTVYIDIQTGGQLYLGSIIIPVGSVYKIVSGSILSWMELR